MPDGWIHVALFAAGFVAGAINVLAGGGSFLTLPVLIFTGLPATVANATNRVGIVFQNVGAVWGFRRKGVRVREFLPWCAVPAVLGSLLGAWAALETSDRAFTRILAFLMIAVTLWTLWDPLRRWQTPAPENTPRQRLLLATGFLGAGIYGGFIQAGVGFLQLAVTTLAGLDLVRGNAIKVFCALAFSLSSIAVFAAADKVAWQHGVSLGLGTLAGGQLGVHLTVLKGHAWVRGFVTVTILLLAVKLLLAP